MFVVMRSEGDYSDRTEMPVFVTHTEQMAQQIVTRETERERVLFNERMTRGDLHHKGYNLYFKENPLTETFSERKPVFDQSQSTNKEYLKEHKARKHKYEKDRLEFHVTVVADYRKKAWEFADKYVTDNYNSDNIKSDNAYFDIYFCYHAVPVVGENDD